MTQNLFSIRNMQTDGKKTFLHDIFYDTIENTFPIKHKFLQELTHDVAQLSLLLTKDRSMRKAVYLNDNAALNAYLRYFLPWNVYRLCKLNLKEMLNIKNGDTIVDLGAGPLTMVLALRTAMPELLNLKLNFFCIDKNMKIMESGKKLFYALDLKSGESANWNITLIKGGFGERFSIPKANLLCALNVCNEIFWNIHQADIPSLAIAAKKQVAYFSSLVTANGKVFVVEPGVPRCGQFLSLMRNSFLYDTDSFKIEAPCTHEKACPQSGGKRGSKWCHFTFSTTDAPDKLCALSAACALSKERASLSFLLAAKNLNTCACGAGTGGTIPLRITSDIIQLPSYLTGRYACYEGGLALVCGTKSKIEKYTCGTLLQAPLQCSITKQIDKKSGAFIGHL
ncbi:MAG: small ribosomal subunit Rsm22 family protein [Termitinemataceae bacterium]|nr:MAG: small ribosomal subunit Rsm22 family protein [Termitinemataceae bacterium]